MSELTAQNQEKLFRLVAAIEDNQGVMSPLIVVCDDVALRERLITQCEQDLEEGIGVYRVRLNREEPSLRLGVWQCFQEHPELRDGEPGVLMVVGAEELSFVGKSTEGDDNAKSTESHRTDIDKFMGYLQWGREGLTEFPYPIVLWITEQIYLQMINLTDSVRALDFWSWRRVLVKFEGEGIARQIQEAIQQIEQASSLELKEDALRNISSLEELQDLISKIEQRNPQDSRLGILYDALGTIYHWRLKQGQADDFAQELEKAHKCFEKAIKLQQGLGLKQELVASFQHQGLLYEDSAKFTVAINYYQKSLTLAKEIENRQGEAFALGSLGSSYYFLSEYREAIAFYEQQLEITREIGDRQGEANSLGGLGITYHALGQYQEALTFHEQQLEITRETGDRQGEAASLGNSGIAYHALGQYRKAITFHEKHLEIARKTGDRKGEANSLGSLGNAYYSLGQYRESLAFYEQSLEIQRETGDRQREATSLGNLGNVYDSIEQHREALAFYEQSLEIQREIGDRQGEANSLSNLGNAYDALGQYREAIAFYEQSLEIQREIGDRQGKALSLGRLGIAYNSLGEYREAIAVHQQSLEITQEIGDRHGQLASLFNMANAFIRLDDRWGARHNYQQALTLAQEMGLDHRVKQCEKALVKLSEQVVVKPRRAPEIGSTPNTPTPPRPRTPKQPPLFTRRKSPLEKWLLRLWRSCVQLVRAVLGR